MSLDDLNREQKRSLKKMGALDEQGRPTRAPAPQATKRKERLTPAIYLREVRDEMRKVARDLGLTEEYDHGRPERPQTSRPQRSRNGHSGRARGNRGRNRGR